MKTAKEILGAAQREKRGNLPLSDCRAILAEAGVPLNGSAFAATRAEVVARAAAIGFPVVMKIVSPDVVHKTEAGGVRLGLRDGREVGEAFDEMTRTVAERVPGARIEGVTVDEQVSGIELIIGSVRDAQFGPLLMFGIGGIFVEVYKDVTFRLIPLERADALEMLEELRGRAILQGARGLPKADPEELAGILLAVSRLVEAHPAIRELDVNPLVLSPKGLRAIDARILIDVD